MSDWPATGQADADAPRDWTAGSLYALGLLTLIYSLNYLDRFVLSLVLPQLKRDMHLSDTALGLLAGFAFVLFYSLAGLPIARLADRSNRRNILGLGLVVWSLMTALSGLATNIWQLAVTRFLMGAGESCGIAPSNSMVADLFSKAARPMAVAILVSGSSLAFVLFFPMVGWITQNWGWRAAFICSGAPGVLLALLLFLTVKEPIRSRDTMAADPHQEKFADALRLLWRSPVFALIAAGGSFMGINLYASSTWHPMFLVRVHGFDLAQVGATLGPLRGFAGLLGGLLGGFLADRLGRKDERWRLWVPGLACVLILPLELVFLLSENVTLALVALGAAQLSASAHLGPVYAACMSAAKANMRTTAAAMFLLCANLVGQIFGPLSVGYLNDIWQARIGPTAIRYSLIVGAICAALGGIAFLFAARFVRRTPAAPTPVSLRSL